jgi:peptidoglycan hydrolase-like protein with peptidoglycan-binding domain
MVQFLVLVVSGLFLAGCATTQPTAVNQLQIKVAQLERKLEEKDQEVTDLRDQLDDVSTTKTSPETIVDEVDEDSMKAVSSAMSSSSYGDIIRVDAKPQDVQRALKNAGFYDGPIDGKIGAKTKKAIQAFQKEHSLTSDGVIGKKTWTELKTYLKD